MNACFGKTIIDLNRYIDYPDDTDKNEKIWRKKVHYKFGRIAEFVWCNKHIDTDGEK